MIFYTIDRPDFAPFVSNFPSRPVYSGRTLALEAKAMYQPLAPNSSEDILEIAGTGALTGALLIFGGSFGWGDMAELGIELYIDGTQRAKWTLQDFELFNGLNIYNKASGSGSSGWYYADVLNPIISPIAGKWDATNSVFTEYYVYLNFIAEFTDSLVFRVFNNTSSTQTFSIKALVGHYP